MISNRNYNILQLYNLFTNEFSAFDFAFRMNLLYQSFNCRNCGSIVSIYTNNDQKFGLCFKCSKCKRFYGTLLEEGIISMGLSQKVKGVFNHKGWFQWTFNFMLRKII